MSDLRELYQQLIMDHSRHPRNFGACCHADHTKEGYNPLCGDRLTIYVIEKEGVLEDVTFDGAGCAISMASASLMTEAVKGKRLDEVGRMFEDFHALVTKGENEEIENRLKKIAVLGGVSEYPARVKCATLAWHTLMGALRDDASAISTE